MRQDDKTLYTMPQGVETRWATPENPRGRKGGGGKRLGGRKGSSAFVLMAGKQIVLAEEKNTSGVIRRIWMTLSDLTPKMLRSIRLDIYWDGASTPAVSAPIGDFFGIGLGRMSPFQSAVFSSPEGRSFNCQIPMPFRTGMKVVAVNEGDEHLYYLFYEINYTVGDDIGADALYFHAHFRSENPTELRKDYEILPKLKGRGRFLDCNIGVEADKNTYYHAWWGEGECKIYLDEDEAFPTLCGTGTEDYIGTGWELGAYQHLTQGCPIADHERMHFCFYRYHINDPLYFHRAIRVTMQQIGSWKPECPALFKQDNTRIVMAGPEYNGAYLEADFSDLTRVPPFALFERQDKWSSCAYFYLDSPENSLPALEPVEQRLAALPHYDEKELNVIKSVPVAHPYHEKICFEF